MTPRSSSPADGLPFRQSNSKVVKCSESGMGVTSPIVANHYIAAGARSYELLPEHRHPPPLFRKKCLVVRFLAAPLTLPLRGTSIQKGRQGLGGLRVPPAESRATGISTCSVK